MLKIKDDVLQGRVDRALDTAVFENGYLDLMDQHPSEVARDLCEYESDLEHEDVGEVQDCVVDYLAWYRSRGDDEKVRTKV